MDLLVHQCGGYDNIGHTEKDLHNRIANDKKRESTQGDAERASGYLYGIGARDHGFYCKYSVDAENKLSNINKCNAMESTIAKVLPNTTHRLCSWHLEKNAM